MRIAVISDIHGNGFALEAVLADLQNRSIDHIVNLGDIFYGPIAPRKTYELLQKYEIITICGNQDRQIYESTVADIEANPTMGFVLDELQGEPMEWLRSLPGERVVNDTVYLCHGGPGDDMLYFLEDISSGSPQLRCESDIISNLGGRKESLILCGHTHVPRTVELRTGQLIVNPGSVGLPAYCDDEPVPHRMETFSSHASYAIVEENDRGWRVEHIRVAYDTEAATMRCQKLKRQDWIYFLETGRADLG